jgi:hypothetical protein
MNLRVQLVFLAVGAVLLAHLVSPPGQACCPAPPGGKPVVNADQTVILIWDAATGTQHFIRQASFKSEAEDFGFLVPTPSQPELDESGNDAFGLLRKLTEPERKKVPRPRGGMGCGCGALPMARQAGNEPTAEAVLVLDEKRVAGFNAAVLETRSTAALVNWLKTNGYAFSPEVEAWARPYVEQGWKITALKVAKGKDGQASKDVAASALRMTFKTDRPLFPYREPESRAAVAQLGVHRRLLRIYFLADARYDGGLTPETPWTGRVAWAGKVGADDRRKALELLNVAETAGPAEWWLTEFEDPWPYQAAPADVYFARAADQNEVRRPPIIEYVAAPLPTDLTVYALAVALVVPPVWRRIRSKQKK